MRNLLNVGVAGALLVTLGACATKKPVEDAVAPPPPPPAVDTSTNTRVETTPVQTVQGPTPGSIDDFTINVGDRVYFDLDSFTLDGQDRARLDRQAAWLQSYPSVRLLVAGNCDERGTREYNLALGEKRANAVKSYLVSMGIDPARIETVSYGKERPIDPRSTDEAWSLNRNSQSQITSGVGG